MKSSISILAAAGLALLTFGCSPKVNQYMVHQTPEYIAVTQQFVGLWQVDSVKDGDKDQMMTPFSQGSVALNFDTQMAKFTFTVSQAYLDAKLIDWQQKWPDLMVSEYQVVTTATWKISESGAILYFDGLKNTAEVTGSGENFDSFAAFEKTKFVASETVGAGGGLMGLAMNVATKAATGSKDLFPGIPSQVNFKFSADHHSVHLFDVFGATIDLSK